MDNIERKLKIAMGEETASLVLKNAKIVNVFSREIELGDIAIEGKTIVGIGSYSGLKEIDMTDKYVCPGFMDGHMHLESSMLTPEHFQEMTIKHGTCTCFVDPHEIANVAGVEGIKYILDKTSKLKQNIYVNLPSCVPSTSLDESGAVLLAKDLEPFINNENVKGLAELMDSFSLIRGDKNYLDKIKISIDSNKIVDGHFPLGTGNELNAYVLAGVGSDHECSKIEEALEKIRRGQIIMVREGTAARNMEDLKDLLLRPYCERVCLCCDDVHPDLVIRHGHIDSLLKKAVSFGADPIDAIAMASYNTARYFKVNNKGAIAPGYDADVVVVKDLKDFEVESVIINGEIVHDKGVDYFKYEDDDLKYPHVFNSFNLSPINENSFEIKNKPLNPQKIRVIELVEHDLVTNELIEDYNEFDGYAEGVDISKDILQVAVLERHQNTGHVAVGYLKGYGLKSGAVVTSIGHDSHNIVVVGTNHKDMALAVNTVIKNKGGLAITNNGQVDGQLALEVGGLMSLKPAKEVDEAIHNMKHILRDRGLNVKLDPFMSLAFISLTVIPSIKINTLGLVDVTSQKYVDVFVQ